MRDAILNFPGQFQYEPVIENAERFEPHKKFILSGMGGSHLSGDILGLLSPGLDIVIHTSYGLPKLSREMMAGRLFIASSYSGNTEEAVHGLRSALEAGVPSVVITTGGKLLGMAKENDLPYVQMPATGLQPRSALGYSLNALIKVVGDETLLAESRDLTKTLSPLESESHGKSLAGKLKGKFPVIYSSLDNLAIAYNWKIAFNETGKIPAFYNVLPELNHNEMTGFDVNNASRPLSERMYFILLKDDNDHSQIQKRMRILEELYRDRGLSVEVLFLGGESKLHQVFSSLILADWTALYTAEQYGLESEKVPMIEEFKRLIA